MPGPAKRKSVTKTNKDKTSKGGTTQATRENGSGDGEAQTTVTTEVMGKNSNWERKGMSNDSVDSFVITTNALNIALGLIVMVAISYVHAYYMYLIHENQMWFSNVKEVEREISFRTESGLYYSYFKQLVNAPTLTQGLNSLRRDKLTEHPDTINVLARMNIYQEVFLAILHRGLAMKMEPILFYTYSIFGLQSFLIAGLYVLTWLLSGSWLSGLLASAFFIFNRLDTTRVPYTVPLRESFALPFLWIQAAAITVHFQTRRKGLSQTLSMCAMFGSTMCFCLFWQFNQFVLVLQSFSLFALWVLGLASKRKIFPVVMCQQLSLCLVCLMQFGNEMILGSLVVSFNIVFIIEMATLGDFTRPYKVLNIVRIFLLSAISLAAMVAISDLLKTFLRVDSDAHIFKFIQNKLGIGDEKDFDSRLYMCVSVFGMLGADLMQRMTHSFVFPFYITGHLGLLIYMVRVVFSAWGHKPVKKSDKTQAKTNGIEPVARPALLFHTVQCVFFGFLAVMMERMKYFWTPYMCVLAAITVGDRTLWTKMLSSLNLKGDWKVRVAQDSAVLLVLTIMTAVLLPPVMESLENLSEFWDPDTVELMEWISTHTPKGAAFTGSMQLLAGVKLCTGRPITNHPHYEDRRLRLKTKRLYQIYGRREPEDIHRIMSQFRSSYIILEDSICRAPSNGCRTPDIVDISNGVMPDNEVPIPGLVKSSILRFCEAVRHQTARYKKYFTPVFVNKTFRVYQVLNQFARS